MEQTVSFPLSALGASVGELKGIYERLYHGMMENIEEDEIEGIQIYPSKWPRKVIITVKNKELKEKLLIEGIDI